MATRGVICREIEKGKFQWLYSHWDNAPRTNGKILAEHYSSKDKVDTLFVPMRDIRSLSKIPNLTSYLNDLSGNCLLSQQLDNEEFSSFTSLSEYIGG